MLQTWLPVAPAASKAVRTRLELGRKVLVITAGIPHESEGASVVLFYHYIEHTLRAGHKVFHVLLIEGDTWPDEAVRSYHRKITSFGPCEIATIRQPRFVRQGAFGHDLDLSNGRDALERAAEFAADATIAFDILAAWAAAAVETPRRIVWLGDLNFQTMRYHALYAVRESPRGMLALPRHLLAAWHWKRVYRSVLRGADDIVVSSASSVRELAKLGLRSEYEPYPWPMAVGDRARMVPTIPTFMFFGNLVGLGSRSALHLLLRLYGPLLALWGTRGFRVRIAGRGRLPPWFMSAICDKPEIEWLGFVPDLGSLLDDSHAVLAPIEVPVGNRSRILTGLAHGVLVIAHSNVALGNPDLVDGETCALADDAISFLAHLRRAVEHDEWRQSIALNGRRCYQERFHPDRAGPRLALRLADPGHHIAPSAPAEPWTDT